MYRIVSFETNLDQNLVLFESGKIYFQDLTKKYSPISLPGPVKQICIGDESFSILLENGKVFTKHIGDPYYDWKPQIDTSPPVFVREIKGKVKKISGSPQNTIALTNEGDLYAFDSAGEAGSFCTKGERFIDASTSQNHILALDANKVISAYGWNRNGQLGLNLTVDAYDFEKIVNFHKPIIKIAAGFAHSLALDTEGNLFCGVKRPWANLTLLLLELPSFFQQIAICLFLY